MSAAPALSGIRIIDAASICADPRLDAHTEEVLCGELELSLAELARLKQQGTV